MAITIAIVEDNTAVRKSMLDILDGSPGCKSVGSFSSGEQALSEIPKLKPQIVLMDISLTGMDGVECVRRLARLMELPQILMLTVHEDPDSIFNSLAAGAAGYLLKPVRATQLLCRSHQ
jgi:DNA-binding NarL/FixJ family response regulator